MALHASELSPGDRYEEIVVEGLTRTQIVMYAGASGDFNPLHTDEIYATQVAQYPSVIAHGMLTMGITGKALTNYVGDARLKSFGGRFLAWVWPGDTLTARIEVQAVRREEEGHVVDLAITTSNQADEVVFSGAASALVEP